MKTCGSKSSQGERNDEMKSFPLPLTTDSTDSDIFTFMERWIEMLASGKFGEAYEMVSHDPYYKWTPELIQKTIEGYGLPEAHPAGLFKITAPGSAKGKPSREVSRTEGVPPGAFATVMHDLPLNGEWSDLAVTFRFEPADEGAKAILEEIHVF